jgi:hypothetical protein
MSGPLHTFVVLAYGRSPFLESCLESLHGQSVASVVTVSTSTPFAGLEDVCARFGADLRVHGPNRGIGHDWNMGLRAAETAWVTLAHQDDVYAPGYAAFVHDVAARHPDDLLAFCAYDELVGDRTRAPVPMLRVKRGLIEAAYLGRGRITGRRAKRRLLRFGNPVACPTVALHRARLADFGFRADMKTNMDWMAWLDLADREGGFSFERAPLVSHRIHAESETSATIGSGSRSDEDLQVFERLWPRPLARGLSRLYALSYRSNTVVEPA